MDDKIRVIELFAGVGGFRLGLEGWNGKSATSGYKLNFETPYRVVWSNQWEPSTTIQHASRVYEARFGSEDHSNSDIFPYPVKEIPDHEMLVGGFPCQDYSVARTLNQADGLKGKKGVLWWAIERIVRETPVRKRPKVLFLENVDRLLKSPANQRGRDFAVMLASLSKLEYVVEWRVINAAEYGFPQRRRRVFILAYHKSSNLAKEAKRIKNKKNWLLSNGIFAEAFPVNEAKKRPYMSEFTIEGELSDVSENFPMDIYGTLEEESENVPDHSPFENSGLMVNRIVTTIRTEPDFHGELKTLGDVVALTDQSDIDESFYLEEYSLKTWRYLKGAKTHNPRVSKSGFEYHYNEGPVAFPDSLEKPSRTIITGEGGSTPSRFKHVIEEAATNRLRRLIPEELERLNMFPPGHTKLEGISDIKRAFFMGNALVVGVVENIGRVLAERLKTGEKKNDYLELRAAVR